MQQIKIKILIALLAFSVAATAQKKDGIISLQMSANDSMHVVAASVTDVTTKSPLKDVEITFYVKRTFGLMKVGEGTTDSSGIVNAEFPKDIRADANGKVIFVAKVEDNDVMNDTAFHATLKSDLPHLQDQPVPHSIIGAHAPWWLAVTFTVIVGTVWLLFVYVIYLVYRIKKASTFKIISSTIKN